MTFPEEHQSSFQEIAIADYWQAFDGFSSSKLQNQSFTIIIYFVEQKIMVNDFKCLAEVSAY